MNGTVVITFDIDWAPTWMIDWVAGILIEKAVKATWFVTHPSPAIERLKERSDLFELGIHPNFLPGSTQGNTPENILDYCLSIVPDAISVRTHALVQSSPILSLIRNKGLLIDVSILLPDALFIQPVFTYVIGGTLCRIPFFWEDDHEFQKEKPSWAFLGGYDQSDGGIKIYNFHPVHIYLNSPNMKPYGEFKCSLGNRPLCETTKTEIENFIHQGNGTRRFFKELVEKLGGQMDTYCIRDLYRGRHD